MEKLTISSFKTSEEIEKILNEKAKKGFQVTSFSLSKISLKYHVKMKKAKSNTIYTLSSKPIDSKGLKLISDDNILLYSSKIKPLISEEQRQETNRVMKSNNYWKITDIIYILFAIYFIVAIKEKPYSMNRLMYLFPITLVYSLLNLLIRNHDRKNIVKLIITSILTSAVMVVIIELIYVLYSTITGFFYQ